MWKSLCKNTRATHSHFRENVTVLPLNKLYSLQCHTAHIPREYIEITFHSKSPQVYAIFRSTLRKKRDRERIFSLLSFVKNRNIKNDNHFTFSLSIFCFNICVWHMVLRGMSKAQHFIDVPLLEENCFDCLCYFRVEITFFDVKCFLLFFSSFSLRSCMAFTFRLIPNSSCGRINRNKSQKRTKKIP